jgi:AcrR family transcriptional regulator
VVVPEPVKKARRAYSSPARADGARRTRAEIVMTATRMFTERGYIAVSIAEIAQAAGVARPTVVNVFGSKPALLKVVLDQALTGDDEPVPVAQRPWFRPVWDAESPAGVLLAYAAVCVVIAERAAEVVEVVRRASDSAPEVADLWASWQRGRRAGAAMVIDRPLLTAALRTDLDPASAADVLWTLNDPALRLALVTERGWSPAGFERWLGATMCRELLQPTGP